MRRQARILKVMATWQHKPGRLRDRDHLDWVKTLPCLACGCRPPCDPGHLRFNAADPIWKGAMGARPADDKCVPLCRRCHDEEERGKLTFWAACMDRGISDPIGVAQRLRKISGDTDRGYAAIAHARPGLQTAWLAAA